MNASVITVQFTLWIAFFTTGEEDNGDFQTEPVYLSNIFFLLGVFALISILFSIFIIVLTILLTKRIISEHVKLRYLLRVCCLLSSFVLFFVYFCIVMLVVFRVFVLFVLCFCLVLFIRFVFLSCFGSFCFCCFCCLVCLVCFVVTQSCVYYKN